LHITGDYTTVRLEFKSTAIPPAEFLGLPEVDGVDVVAVAGSAAVVIVLGAVSARRRDKRECGGCYRLEPARRTLDAAASASE
jgi:hypothetical protein